MIHLIAKFKPMTDGALAVVKMLLGLDRPHLYRPEAHYMRGPGPKWREKHGLARRRLAVQKLSTMR